MVEEAEKTITDPHAWQSLANGKIYVANIRDALIAADPDGKATYEANAQEIPRRHRRRWRPTVKEAVAKLPPDAPQDHHHAMTPSAISARPTAWSSSRLRA